MATKEEYSPCKVSISYRAYVSFILSPLQQSAASSSHYLPLYHERRMHGLGMTCRGILPSRCAGNSPDNHFRATGYGNVAAYNDIWIVWFSIPLMSGIGTSNKLIHCPTAESPSFFQKLLFWLKRSTPIASASFPIPWSFQVRFCLYTSFFEAVDILF